MIEARTARLCPAVFCHFQQSKPVPKSKLAAVAEKLNPPLRRHSNFKFKCFCMNINKLEGRLKTKRAYFECISTQRNARRLLEHFQTACGLCAQCGFQMFIHFAHIGFSCQSGFQHTHHFAHVGHAGGAGGGHGGGHFGFDFGGGEHLRHITV